MTTWSADMLPELCQCGLGLRPHHPKVHNSTGMRHQWYRPPCMGNWYQATHQGQLLA